MSKRPTKPPARSFRDDPRGTEARPAFAGKRSRGDAPTQRERPAQAAAAEEPRASRGRPPRGEKPSYAAADDRRGDRPRPSYGSKPSGPRDPAKRDTPYAAPYDARKDRARPAAGKPGAKVQRETAGDRPHPDQIVVYVHDDGDDDDAVEQTEKRAPAPHGTWLWGRHAVLAALRNPERKLLRLVSTADVADELATLGDDGMTRSVVARDALAKLLPPGAVHQGMALLTRGLKPLLIEDLLDRAEAASRAVVLALDQVTDPHNIGAILRSAAAFGAMAVIMPDRNAPEVSGTLAKSASGAVEHVPLIRVVNLNRTLDQLKSAGFWCIGLDGAAEGTLAAQRLDGKTCLVLGSEGDGMRRLTREACDLMAKLPTSGPVASLNVSNAAAIALYEWVRAGQ